MSSPGRMAMEALMAAQNATNNTEVAWEAAAQAVIDHVTGPDNVVVDRIDLAAVLRSVGKAPYPSELLAISRLRRALS